MFNVLNEINTTNSMRYSINYKAQIINLKISKFTSNHIDTNSKHFDIRNVNANCFEYA